MPGYKRNKIIRRQCRESRCALFCFQTWEEPEGLKCDGGLCPRGQLLMIIQKESTKLALWQGQNQGHVNFGASVKGVYGNAQSEVHSLMKKGIFMSYFTD